MLFNTIDFAIFLPVVFILHWMAAHDRPRLQNTILLLASYFFYSCWDWRFSLLLAFSTLLDYSTGIAMTRSRSETARRSWFWTSIIVNVGLLCAFKYFNFFTESFAAALASLGVRVNPFTLQVILPVGISFYTFHGLSYVVDIYKRQIDAERDIIDYALFVSFFPLLVAGPIERATHLLPQLKRARTFDPSSAVDGLRQIIWGLFKKVVIADNCAEFANHIFGHSADQPGSTLLLGAIFFAFQIYADFSGYSDIALGTARLFGIELLRNFAFPYFSRDIAEFWRRWHISLSSWFRDYLYIPLGGSRGGTGAKVRNTFIIFLVSGFWHGANWTFLAWGLLNALYFLPLLLSSRNRENLGTVAEGRLLPNATETMQMASTFLLTVIAWVFFRANDVTHALQYIGGMLSPTLFTMPVLDNYGRAAILCLFIVLFMAMEWVGRNDRYAIERIGLHWSRPARHAMYYAMIASVFWFGGREQEFIYFQF